MFSNQLLDIATTIEIEGVGKTVGHLGKRLAESFSFTYYQNLY